MNDPQLLCYPQTCMLLDIFCGTNILSDFTIWLGLPILAHSGTNPWIYAFHHGEMRVAAGKIAEELVALFGVSPSRYGCSPTRRGSNTNLELAEVNCNSNEERRPPVEDCFAAKHHQHHQHQSLVYASKRCLNSSTSRNGNEISPAEDAERGCSISTSSSSTACNNNNLQTDVVEEDIHDLTKMLEPRYMIERNQHLVDSNHNIDKIRNLKYLLDPTFSKIRHLRRLNHKRIAVGKSVASSRFVSYQNLKTESPCGRRSTLHINTMSDPMLNADDGVGGPLVPRLQRPRVTGSNLASVSDSNIIVQESSQLNPERRQQQQQHKRSFSSWTRARQRLELAKSHRRPAEAAHKSDSLMSSLSRLTVPTIHSEPPSPIAEPLRPLDALREEDCCSSETGHKPLALTLRLMQRKLKSPASIVRHSDPLIPSVLLNIEDFSNDNNLNELSPCGSGTSNRTGGGEESGPVSPKELSDLLLLRYDELTRERDCSNSRLKFPTDSIFPEHDSTRFSSRRPSDSRWSESSRSQEVLSNLSEQPAPQRFPSSYSVNNFQSCNFKSAGSDLNDLTSSCLEPFMCSDALSSPLRESFFGAAASVPDSEDNFTSFETDEAPCEPYEPYERHRSAAAAGGQSRSSANLVRRGRQLQDAVQVRLQLQSKSTESMFRDREQKERLCAIFKLEPSIHRNRPRLRPIACKEARLAPLATPTPTDICTPTFDITVVADIKGETGLGVRV